MSYNCTVPENCYAVRLLSVPQSRHMGVPCTEQQKDSSVSLISLIWLIECLFLKLKPNKFTYVVQDKNNREYHRVCQLTRCQLPEAQCARQCWQATNAFGLALMNLIRRVSFELIEYQFTEKLTPETTTLSLSVPFIRTPLCLCKVWTLLI